MEPWRVYRPVVAVTLIRIWKRHKNKKLDLEPHLSEKLDQDRISIEVMRIRKPGTKSVVYVKNFLVQCSIVHSLAATNARLHFIQNKTKPWRSTNVRSYAQYNRYFVPGEVSDS